MHNMHLSYHKQTQSKYCKHAHTITNKKTKNNCPFYSGCSPTQHSSCHVLLTISNIKWHHYRYRRDSSLGSFLHISITYSLVLNFVCESFSCEYQEVNCRLSNFQSWYSLGYFFVKQFLNFSSHLKNAFLFAHLSILCISTTGVMPVSTK